MRYSTTSSKAVLVLLGLLLAFGSLLVPLEGASAAEPSAPQNLRIVEKTHNSVTVAWDPVEGVDPYATGYWLSPGGWASGVEPKTIGGLEPDTDYTIRVKVNVLGAPEATIAARTAQADPDAVPVPPLSPPSGLTVTEMTYSSVTLQWDASVSPETNGYDIYVNDGWGGGTWSLTDTTKTIEGLTVTGDTYGTYTFYVAGQDLPRVSAPSNKVTITLGRLEAPRDVQLLTANRTTASVGWAKTPGAKRYEVYLNGALSGVTEDNRYVFEGLTEGTSYSARIVAKSDELTSPESEAATFMPGKDYTLFKYYTSWSIYGRGYNPADIDVSKLTHINYAFADICWSGFTSAGVDCRIDGVPLQREYNFDGEIVLGDKDADPVNFAALRDMKAAHPHVKTMISVGGWSWSDHFSDMAATPLTRHAFANSVVDFLREYGLDGIDVDWEYPVAGGEADNSRRPEDRENFPLLFELLRAKLDAAGQQDGKYYLLTIASGQGDDFVENANLARAASSLDFVNIMTYDYSGSWDTTPTHNAPLYRDPANPTMNAARFHVHGGVMGHLNGGVPDYKLVLGYPFYGKGWKGCEPNGQYKACEGGTDFGTWENAAFDYSDLETNYVGRNGYVRYWNEASKVPYLFNTETGTYISYDDPSSAAYKAAYIKEMNLAGAMVWEVSGDRNGTISTRLALDLPIDPASPVGSSLAAPTNLASTAVESTALSVSWAPSEGATGYDVFVDGAWAGAADGSGFKIVGLAPNTEYAVSVGAVKKNGDGTIAALSPRSGSLRVKTAAPPVPSSGSGGAPLPSPVAADGHIEASVTRGSGKVSVDATSAAAVASIRRAAGTTLRLVVDNVDDDVEAALSQEAVDAIAEKGASASIVVSTDQVEYTIPIAALSTGDAEAVRWIVSIRKPRQELLDEIAAASGDIRWLAPPLEFTIEAVDRDGRTTEVATFDGVYLVRSFALPSGDYDGQTIAGVAASADGRLTYVPTTISEREDGTITAALRRTGNSVYAVVASDVRAGYAPSWAKEAVEAAVSAYLIEADVGFASDRLMKRAEFASLLVRALGISPKGADAGYEDVSADSPFAAEIGAARSSGIVAGRTPERFDPDARITRQEMAAMLSRAIAFAGVEAQVSPNELDRFADRGDVAPYAESAFAESIALGILQGVGDGRLEPLSNATRAQAVVAVMRLIRTLS
ncbi:glycosyl hydrolase family 18 protein [Paenibacillus sp. TRM 82003]|nr:glycosyl hydrolase family 18 protein [Paenibacillus sp. TRM 82003]